MNNPAHLFKLLSSALDRQHDASRDYDRYTEEVTQISGRLAEMVVKGNIVTEEPEHLLAAIIMLREQDKLVSRRAINLRNLFADATVRILRLKEEFDAHVGEMFAVTCGDNEDHYAEAGIFVDFGVVNGNSRWMKPWELKEEMTPRTARFRSGGSVHPVYYPPELSLFGGDVRGGNFFLRRRIAVGNIAVRNFWTTRAAHWRGFDDDLAERYFQRVLEIVGLPQCAPVPVG